MPATSATRRGVTDARLDGRSFWAAAVKYGHGLHDVLAPNAPFTAAELFGEGAGGSAPLTNADVLRGTEADVAPYTYDQYE
jgi:hypothetical protein